MTAVPAEIDQVNPGKLKGWIPKKWKPVYDQMIILSFVGNRKNIEIAQMFNYSPVRVSQILNCPQALAIKALLKQRVLDEAHKSVENNLRAAMTAGADKIKEILTDDAIWRASPLAAMDRVLKLMVLLGESKEKKEAKGDLTIQKAIILQPEQLSRLQEAMAISDAPMPEIPRQVIGEYNRSHE